MNKQVLSPFDCDMCAMIEDITKQSVEVTASDTSIRLSWAQNGSDGNDKPEAQRIEALKQAIRGRLGDRLIEFFYANGKQSVYMKYNPTEYPEEKRDFLVAIDPKAGQRYCRTLQEVTAMQVDREKLEELKAFTGGGMLTIPREPNARAMYTFPNGNGMLVDVPETFFIVRDESNDFTTMHPKEFARLYEPKGVVAEIAEMLPEPMPGLPAIIQQREKQLKLGRNVEHDNKYNAAGELLDVAAALIKNDPDLFGRSGWSWDWWHKVTEKPEKERLAIAGALVAAEIDREETNRVAYENEIAARNNNNKN